MHRCGMEYTNFLHNSDSMIDHSADKPSINYFTKHIRHDFNLLPIIDHKCSIEFISGLFEGHLNISTLIARHFA